jgi:hypothetical protein
MFKRNVKIVRIVIMVIMDKIGKYGITGVTDCQPLRTYIRKLAFHLVIQPTGVI